MISFPRNVHTLTYPNTNNIAVDIYKSKQNYDSVYNALVKYITQYNNERKNVDCGLKVAVVN